MTQIIVGGYRMNETHNTRNVCFDFLKGIACICVVFIHFKFPGNLGIVVGALSKFAVPLFFMISGYYAQNGQKYKVKNKIIHIIQIIVPAEVVIFLYECLKAIVLGRLNSYFSETFNYGHLIQSVLFNKPLTYSHLWFLYALIYCYVLLWVIKKFKLVKLVLPLIICGQLFFILLGEGLTSIEKSYYFTLNIFGESIEVALYNLFFFRALPYFLMGVYVRGKYENTGGVVISKRMFYIFLIGGSILEIIERYTLGWFQFYVGTIFVVIAIFVKAMSEDISFNRDGKFFKFITHIGLKDSDHIYIIHMLIGSMILTASKIANVVNMNGFAYKLVVPIMVVIISLFLAEVRNKFLELRKSC